MAARMSEDDIRPRGTVEVKCSAPDCGWCFWLDALDPSLPDGPFLCWTCDPATRDVPLTKKAE